MPPPPYFVRAQRPDWQHESPRTLATYKRTDEVLDYVLDFTNFLAKDGGADVEILGATAQETQGVTVSGVSENATEALFTVTGTGSFVLKLEVDTNEIYYFLLKFYPLDDTLLRDYRPA